MHISGKTHIGPAILSSRDVTTCLVSVIGALENSSDWIQMELVTESVAAAKMPTLISWEQL